MNKKDYAISFVLLLIAFFSRIPLTESMQSHWDGPQYSMGVVKYSLEQDTPSPPGYPLYIFIARLINQFIGDPHRALVLESIIFSLVGAVIFYLVGKNIFNRVVGVISSLVFLSGSTFYYFGLTAYAYGAVPSITASIALVVFFIVFKKKHYGLMLGFLFAFSLGFRPQEIFSTFPLVLYGFFNLPLRQRFASLLFFLLSFLAWLLPFVYVVGGIEKYIVISYTSASSGGLPLPAFNNSITFLPRIIKGFFLSFGVSILFLICYLLKNFKSVFTSKYIIFFSVWIFPSLLFNLFIRNDHAGYQMSYLSCFIILISYSIYKCFEKNKFLLAVIVALCILFNVFWFFRDRDPGYLKPYIPTSFHYSEIRKNNIKLENKIKFIKNKFNPEDTLIITSDQLWRPTMYYLDKFLTYDIAALTNKEDHVKYSKRESRYWSRREYKQYIFEFIIPKGIINVVFMNDEALHWVKNREKISYNLPASSKVIQLKVIPGAIVRYGFNYLMKF